MQQLDATLADAVHRDQAVVDLLADLASAGRWTGPTGVVRVEALLPGGDADARTLGFDADGARLRDPSTPPDLTLRMDLRDPERPRIDPSPDPVAVSVAVGTISTAHLAALMASGFRGVVLAEVFRQLPSFLNAEKAARARVSIGFAIGGRDDGLTDHYVVRIDQGECTVLSGAAADVVVDATLDLEGHEFLRLVLGHLNPVRGVLSGQIKVRGQVVKALGFNAVMHIPGR